MSKFNIGQIVYVKTSLTDTVMTAIHGGSCMPLSFVITCIRKNNFGDVEIYEYDIRNSQFECETALECELEDAEIVIELLKKDIK